MDDNVAQSVARAVEARRLLVDDLARVPQDMRNVGAKPSATTIASLALHAAAFEMIIAAAVRPELVDDQVRSVWPIAEQGYWRELGRPAPTGVAEADTGSALEGARELLLRA